MNAATRIRLSAELSLARLGLVLIPALPRRAVLGLARVLGACGYAVCRTPRRIAFANLDLAFGPNMSRARKAAIVRASFRVFSLVILDFFWFTRRTRERLDAWVDFGPMVLDRLRIGPAIAVTAHLGNWEVMGQAAARHGCEVVSVVMPVRNPAIDTLVNRIRTQTGQRTAARSGAMRTALRTLRGGGVVAFVMDQNTKPAEGGTFVSFFGQPAAASLGAAMLSARTAAPINPLYCVPVTGGRYRAYAGEPILPQTFGGNEEAITQAILGALEQAIRDNPECWLWMYRRWKYFAPGVPPSNFPFYAHPIPP